jgi:hypothetical protein
VLARTGPHQDPVRDQGHLRSRHSGSYDTRHQVAPRCRAARAASSTQRKCGEGGNGMRRACSRWWISSMPELARLTRFLGGPGAVRSLGLHGCGGVQESLFLSRSPSLLLLIAAEHEFSDHRSAVLIKTSVTAPWCVRVSVGSRFRESAREGPAPPCGASSSAWPCMGTAIHGHMGEQLVARSARRSTTLLPGWQRALQTGAPISLPLLVNSCNMPREAAGKRTVQASVCFSARSAPQGLRFSYTLSSYTAPTSTTT